MGVFLQDLERFLQESYKICKKCSKILPDSCQILAKILHDISSSGGSIINRSAFHSAKATHLPVVAYSVLQYLLSLVEN